MAYFIIETEEQLERLTAEEDSYVEVIVGNNNYHPKLNKLVGLYYRTKEKGYILPVDHSETLSLSIDSIKHFLGKHKSIYCWDKKQFSYFFHNRVNDIMSDSIILYMGLIIMDD
jgi:hypothetical protein